MDRPFTEIGVMTLIALVCVVVWISASALPPGSFEPLGSGPVPKYTALVVFLCCLFVIFRAVRRIAVQKDVPLALSLEMIGGRPMMAVLMLLLSCIYVAIIQTRAVHFAPLTIVYVTLLIWGMEGFSRRKLLPAVLTATVAGLGASYVFTRIFIVDLPV